MKNKKKEKHGTQRNRPAMIEETSARGRLYTRISNVLILIFLIYMVFSTEAFPLLGENPLYGLVEMPAWEYAFPILFVCMGAAIILRRKGGRHEAPRFIELDSPPGVLYLRPFSEDTDWRFYYSWGRDHLSTSFRNKLKVFKFSLRLQKPKIFGGIGTEFGDILPELTRDFGKMAAIGEPGSPPILGADNVYVSDDNWKEKVLHMARGANLVILTAGTTPGVLWEVEHMVKYVSPSLLLLNVPGGTSSKRQKKYAAFRAAANEIFPRGLPPSLKARVMTFSDDWSPIEVSKNQPPKGTSSHVAWWMSHVLPCVSTIICFIT